MSAVARFIDSETGMSFGSTLIKKRTRILKKLVPERRISSALQQTIRRIAPLDASQLLPTEEVKSARLVADVLLGTACLATSETAPSKEHWESCEKHALKLARTLLVFLQELCGRPTQKERDEDTFHALEEKFASKLNENLNERLMTERMARWGSLLCAPDIIIAVADSLREIEESGRKGCLGVIQHALIHRDTRPSHEEILEILQIITTPPAGKA